MKTSQHISFKLLTSIFKLFPQIKPKWLILALLVGESSARNNAPLNRVVNNGIMANTPNDYRVKLIERDRLPTEINPHDHLPSQLQEQLYFLKEQIRESIHKWGGIENQSPEFYKVLKYLLQGCLEIDENDRDCLNDLAAIEHYLGNKHETLRLFVQIGAANPGSIINLNNIITLAYDLGENETILKYGPMLVKSLQQVPSLSDRDHVSLFSYYSTAYSVEEIGELNQIELAYKHVKLAHDSIKKTTLETDKRLIEGYLKNTQHIYEKKLTELYASTINKNPQEAHTYISAILDMSPDKIEIQKNHQLLLINIIHSAMRTSDWDIILEYGEIFAAKYEKNAAENYKFSEGLACYYLAKAKPFLYSEQASDQQKSEELVTRSREYVTYAVNQLMREDPNHVGIRRLKTNQQYIDGIYLQVMDRKFKPNRIKPSDYKDALEYFALGRLLQPENSNYVVGNIQLLSSMILDNGTREKQYVDIGNRLTKLLEQYPAHFNYYSYGALTSYFYHRFILEPNHNEADIYLEKACEYYEHYVLATENLQEKTPQMIFSIAALDHFFNNELKPACKTRFPGKLSTKSIFTAREEVINLVLYLIPLLFITMGVGFLLKLITRRARNSDLSKEHSARELQIKYKGEVEELDEKVKKLVEKVTKAQTKLKKSEDEFSAIGDFIAAIVNANLVDECKQLNSLYTARVNYQDNLSTLAIDLQNVLNSLPELRQLIRQAGFLKALKKNSDLYEQYKNKFDKLAYSSQMDLKNEYQLKFEKFSKWQEAIVLGKKLENNKLNSQDELIERMKAARKKSDRSNNNNSSITISYDHLAEKFRELSKSDMLVIDPLVDLPPLTPSNYSDYTTERLTQLITSMNQAYDKITSIKIKYIEFDKLEQIFNTALDSGKVKIKVPTSQPKPQQPLEPKKVDQDKIKIKEAERKQKKKADFLKQREEENLRRQAENHAKKAALALQKKEEADKLASNQARDEQLFRNKMIHELNQDVRVVTGGHLLDLISDTLKFYNSDTDTTFAACEGLIQGATKKNTNNNAGLNIENIIQALNIRTEYHDDPRFITKALHNLVIFGSLAYCIMKFMHILSNLSTDNNYPQLAGWISDSDVAYICRNLIMHEVSILKDKDDSFILERHLELMIKAGDSILKLFKDSFFDLRKNGKLPQCKVSLGEIFESLFKGAATNNLGQEMNLNCIVNTSQIVIILERVAEYINIHKPETLETTGILLCAINFYLVRVGEYYDQLQPSTKAAFKRAAPRLTIKNSDNESLTRFQVIKIQAGHFFSKADEDNSIDKLGRFIHGQKPVLVDNNNLYKPYSTTDMLQLLHLAKDTADVIPVCNKFIADLKNVRPARNRSSFHSRKPHIPQGAEAADEGKGKESNPDYQP